MVPNLPWFLPIFFSELGSASSQHYEVFNNVLGNSCFFNQPNSVSTPGIGISWVTCFLGSTSKVWAPVPIASSVQWRFPQERPLEFLFNWKNKTRSLRTRYSENLRTVGLCWPSLCVYWLTNLRCTDRSPDKGFPSCHQKLSFYNFVSKPKLFLSKDGRFTKWIRSNFCSCGY